MCANLHRNKCIIWFDTKYKKHKRYIFNFTKFESVGISTIYWLNLQISTMESEQVFCYCLHWMWRSNIHVQRYLIYTVQPNRTFGKDTLHQWWTAKGVISNWVDYVYIRRSWEHSWLPWSLTWTATFGNIIEKVWPETVQEVRILTIFWQIVAGTGSPWFRNQVSQIT